VVQVIAHRPHREREPVATAPRAAVRGEARDVELARRQRRCGVVVERSDRGVRGCRRRRRVAARAPRRCAAIRP
jgi:hypothetical protein